MQEEKRRCDVLCVGGGIAGLMAAIKAAEQGASVIVAEKSNTLRSGAAGAGNDHFQCYIPEAHGDFDFFWRELYYGQLTGPLRMMDTEYVRYWYENTFNMIDRAAPFLLLILLITGGLSYIIWPPVATIGSFLLGY